MANIVNPADKQIEQQGDVKVLDPSIEHHDEDFRKKTKTKMTDSIINGNPIQLLFNLYLHQLIAMLVENACSFVSAYFQAQYFGSADFYKAGLYYIPFIQIVFQYILSVIAQEHTIQVQAAIDDNHQDKVQNMYHNHFKIQIIVGFLCSVIGLVVPFTFQKFPEFRTYVIVAGAVQPICNALSVAQISIYQIENRRLLMFSLICVRPILQLFIEMLMYSNYAVSQVLSDGEVIQSLSQNTPTIVGIVVSFVIVTIWIIWLNHGQTILGVTNLTENSLTGAFKPLVDPVFVKQLFSYLLSVVTAITNMAFPIGVLVSARAVCTTYKDPPAINTMLYQLFVFYYFGEVFKTPARAISGMLGPVSIHCRTGEGYKRRFTCALLLIVVSCALIVVLYLLINNFKIVQMFSGQIVQSNDFLSPLTYAGYDESLISTDLLYAAISGACQCLTEVMIIENLVEKSYIILLIPPAAKLLTLFLGNNYLETNVGDEANYDLVLLLMEVCGGACSVLIIAMGVVINSLKGKITGQKVKKETKKQSLDEQLAALK